MQLDEQTFGRIVGGDVSMGSFADEQRTADRVPIARKSHCAELHADGTHGRRIACHIREVSRQGAGLLISSAILDASALVVWLPDREGDELAIECGVVRAAPCIGQSNMVSVGVVFVREYTPHAAPQQAPVEPRSVDPRSAEPRSPVLPTDRPATPEEEAAAIKAIRDAMFS